MAPSWLEKLIVRADNTSDARLTSEKPTLELHYTAVGEHRRIIGAPGYPTPRYEVERRAKLGAWGDKCVVTSPLQGGTEIALLDFHAIPRNYTEIRFSNRDRHIDVHTSKPQFEAVGGLGVLHWKDTGMEAYGRASWELRDETNLVVAVSIDGSQTNGVITLWREGLDAETVEELLVVGIAKIEAYKQLVRAGKIAFVGKKIAH